MHIIENPREKIPNDVYNLITNVPLKQSAEDYSKILEPVCVPLKMQASETNFSDAVAICNELCEALDGQLSSDKQQMLAKRRKMNFTPAHYLSYYLDPRYFDNQVIGATEQHSALEFASEIDSRLLIIAAQFRAQSGPFPKPLYAAARTLPPKDWWQIIDIDSDMKVKIQGLLSCSPTIASLERVFSTYGWIHDEQRSRLDSEKAAKLFCFKILNRNVDWNNCERWI